ncbi:anthranilate synthase family protein [Streptomyces sp. FH025]|uniref:anthranilate synthase family protein n=1 Tax=Streptomyces sp. FH025 TaxID=2815937 RepID=UPI001A9D3493|nr:anthranilate synthase family protein [Streptomyces sp. FH025]MBO1416842.1 chorismate-binding protein [Streptomyces sp. FH025]
MRPLRSLWSGEEAPPFALLYRPGSATGSPDMLDVLVGEVSELESLTQLATPTGHPGDHRQLLAVLPYRQIGERGFAYPEDHAPLLALAVTERWSVPLADALRELPDDPVELTDAGFDIDDDAYAGVVRRLIAEEIGRGEGANFVVRRSFTARVGGHLPRLACAMLRRLLLHEEGAYWTFAVHTGKRAFVGASPERHVSLHGGTAVMNPISGTYRFPEEGPSLAGALRFLADTKESDELYMVVDEELKMMASVCEGGGRVVGPYLKEMAHLAHTEYYLEGASALPAHEVLRRTLPAPTVTGSPVESACRAISRYESEGRGYYSGVVALLGTDDRGRPELDSAIMIRTAELDHDGGLALGVGATVVRHSDPQAEVAETRAKALGVLRALGGPPVAPTRPAPGRRGIAEDPAVRAALAARNNGLADFWLAAAEPDLVPTRSSPDGGRGRILAVDAEDTFTAMLAHQLRFLGAEVTVSRFDEPISPSGYDLVLVGPGPGDPRQLGHPKIAALREVVRAVLAEGLPLFAVCLGHQVLSGLLGLPLVRRRQPNQGVRREIDLFGRRVRVGFYNTFAARAEDDALSGETVGGRVDICRDKETGEIHALRGPGLYSCQFHPESVLSSDGVSVLADALDHLLPYRPHRLPTTSIPPSEAV